MVEKIKIEDLKEALDLVLKVFMEFEAPDYSEDGVREFKKFIEYDKVKISLLNKELSMSVFKSKNKIVGVIAGFRGHINLLFVDKAHHRKGIARQLFNALSEDFKNCVKKITVNSSPYAVEAYKKLGFKNTGGEQVKNGIRFYPMEKEWILK